MYFHGFVPDGWNDKTEERQTYVNETRWSANATKIYVLRKHKVSEYELNDFIIYVRLNIKNFDGANAVIIVRFVLFLYALFPFCPLLHHYSYGWVCYLCGRSPIPAKYASVQYSLRDPRDSAASTFTNGQPADKVFGGCFSSVNVLFALSGKKVWHHH